MDWFKRAAGIKIFVLIWLMILLVPVWQLRAHRQLQTDQLFTDPTATLGLTNEVAKRAAKQFPDDVVAQEAPLSSQYTDEFATSPKLPDIDDGYLKRYADLSRKFPNSNYVRSQWLRMMTRGSLPIESEGLIKSYGISGYTPPPPSEWVSTKNLEAAVNCAKEGAKRDPDNAFWPWMEAVFLFSLRRDDAAIEVLKRAGRCKYFDDGILEVVRQHIALNRRLRLSDWEDESYEQWATILPHLSRLRSVARATMWRAQIAYESGDKAKALQIAGILQRAGEPMAHTQNVYITALVGQAICYVAWSGTLKMVGIKLPDFPSNDEKDIDVRRRFIINRFSAYSRQLGYEQLGQDAFNTYSSLDITKLGKESNEPDFGGVVQKAKVVAQLHWILSWLLKISFVGAGLWLLFFWGTYKNPLEAARVRSLMLVWAAFCLGATGVILFAALQTSIKDFYDSSIFTGITGDKKDNVFDIPGYLPLVLLIIWLTPVILSAIAATIRLRWKGRIKLTRGGVDWGALTRFLIYLSLSIGITTTLKTLSEPSLDTVLGQFWPAPIFITLTSLLALLASYLLATRGNARLGVWFVSGGIALGAAALWLPFLDESFDVSPSFFIAIMSLCFLIVGAFLLGVRPRISSVGIWRCTMDLFLRLHMMAAIVALFGSVFYMLFTFVSIPIRRDAQHETDLQNQMGEVAYLRMKLESKNNSSN